jgi:hypothetical protein
MLKEDLKNRDYTSDTPFSEIVAWLSANNKVEKPG